GEAREAAGKGWVRAERRDATKKKIGPSPPPGQEGGAFLAPPPRPPQRTSHRLPQTPAHAIRRQPPRQRPHRWREAMRSRLARLLRLDVSRADDLAPGRGLELDTGPELLPRPGARFPA